MKRLQLNRPASPTYRQIWRIVDGAVHLALAAHPEYLASGASLKTVRNSIVKRVTGAICGYAEQSAWVRSGSSPADDEAEPVNAGLAVGEALHRFSGPAGGVFPCSSCRSEDEARR